MYAGKHPNSPEFTDRLPYLQDAELLDLILKNPHYITDPYYAPLREAIYKRHREGYRSPFPYMY